MKTTFVGSRQLGFTLIELMAVVLLIGIIAGSTILLFSAGGTQKQFTSALEQFMESASQVSDLSILTGEPVGLVITPPAWAENQLDSPGWRYGWRRQVQVPTENQGQFVPEWLEIDGLNSVSLGPDIQLFVRLEGSEWDWRATPKHSEPIFVILPTGEANPFLFEIEFAHDDLEIEPQHVKLDETGRIQWVELKAERDALRERQEQR